MSRQTSIFSLINSTKNVISMLNDKTTRLHSSYVYCGKSQRGVLKFNLNKNMDLLDPYEIEICSIKYQKEMPLNISCNGIQIYNTNDDSNYSVVFSSDKFIDIKSDLVFDAKIPIPNPLIFIGDNDFEMLIKLSDK